MDAQESGGDSRDSDTHMPESGGDSREPGGQNGGLRGDRREPRGEAAPGDAPRSPADRGLWFGIVAVLLVAIAAVYVWKLVAVSDVRSEMAALEDSLTARSQRSLEGRTEELLRLGGIPLAWAVRTEMLRRNYDQVNAYLSEFVQESGVERVLIGTPGDSILVATDKRLEGRAFSSVLPAELLEIRTPRVERADGDVRLAVPVLGPTRALGVLVLTYRPSPDAPGTPPSVDSDSDPDTAGSGRSSR